MFSFVFPAVLRLGNPVLVCHLAIHKLGRQFLWAHRWRERDKYPNSFLDQFVKLYAGDGNFLYDTSGTPGAAALLIVRRCPLTGACGHHGRHFVADQDPPLEPQQNLIFSAQWVGRVPDASQPAGFQESSRC